MKNKLENAEHILWIKFLQYISEEADKNGMDNPCVINSYPPTTKMPFDKKILVEAAIECQNK